MFIGHTRIRVQIQLWHWRANSLYGIFCNKKRVVDALCLHYCISSSLLELEQTKEGLNVQKFTSLMVKFPEIVRTAFMECTHIISSVIEELYSDYDIVERKQQEILNAWTNYLRGLESNLCLFSYSYSYSLMQCLYI